MSEFMLDECDGKILTITLNRPADGNALNDTGIGELTALLQGAAARARIAAGKPLTTVSAYNPQPTTEGLHDNPKQDITDSASAFAGSTLRAASSALNASEYRRCST